MVTQDNPYSGIPHKYDKNTGLFAWFKRIRDYLNGYADYRQYPSLSLIKLWSHESHEHQLLTSYVATNLYWFGRHLQRIESTLIDTLEIYDSVVDTDKEAGKGYYKHLGIDLEYNNASEFLNRAIFGDHPANLAMIMANARENAIICRTYIDTNAFGETIRLHKLFESYARTADVIDYRFIDEALSLINEIWGIMSRGLVRKKSDHFIRLGKLVEKVDLHLRHGEDAAETSAYLHNILITARRIAPDADITIRKPNDKENLDAINLLINQLVTD